MTGEQLTALAGVAVTLLLGAGGGAFAFVKWLVSTLNTAYKAKVDTTLTTKNLELDLLRDDNQRLRDENERLRQRRGGRR